jgi:hypothetical protein
LAIRGAKKILNLIHKTSYQMRASKIIVEKDILTYGLSLNRTSANKKPTSKMQKVSLEQRSAGATPSCNKLR